MPTPHTGETESDFLDRCIPEVVGEGKPQEQAVAICNSLWEDKMTDKSKLIESIRGRNSRRGIVTADRYFKDVQGCFDGGFCPLDVTGFSEDEWRTKLKEAEQQFTYSNPETEILQKSVTKNTSFGILQFDAIITTPFRDRDKDVLETEGAEVDPKMPLLWQHVPMQPIGKMVQVLRHTKDELRGRFAIADTALGRDAAELIKIGALRISHGFDPIEWKEMDDGEGWRFMKFLIYEVSGVSIPSNIQAEVLEFYEKDFESDIVKAMQQRAWKKQGKVLVPSGEMNDQPESRHEDIPERIAENTKETEKVLCKCEKDAADTETPSEELTEPEEKQALIESIETISAAFEKAGTRLSQSTREELNEVMMDLEAILKMDLPRPVMALANNALSCIRGLMGEEEKSFEDIEKTYFAELAKCDVDRLSRQHQRLSLILNAAKDQQAAKEKQRSDQAWDDFLSRI